MTFSFMVYLFELMNSTIDLELENYTGIKYFFVELFTPPNVVFSGVLDNILNASTSISIKETIKLKQN